MSEVIEKKVQRVLSEDVLTLDEARKELAPLLGQRPDKSTVYRWVMRGVGGTRLESVRIGNRYLTNRQAITRFIQARSV